MSGLRAVLRKPMGIWDEYRALCFKKPREMNFYMMWGCLFFIYVLGRGTEKITMHGEQNNYELKRRLRRAYMPYFVLNYRWGFPYNK